ncbi:MULTISPECIES: MFS transporter [unclassified Duganella]|uniref:MFS transporter n=1 Tax=unclassified Duganella TaxID=2636909 RepID=UPI00088867AB|nr:MULTISPECIES: MFS transporter [unclassified Duganella]SDG53875.1 Predicted arabinose efflux permease, MFS family [Duganella sp. OV458]SDJ76572.1 Predicted arabinose efflux permease, MFS family [Duganella sp. OV510]
MSAPVIDAQAGVAHSTTSADVRRFLIGFVGLTLLSGMTIGMNKVLSTLLGIHLGVSNLQLAVISSAETFAMALGTIPAGYILARGNPKYLYAAVSLTLSAAFCALPWLPGWQWVALLMFLVGLCISLRIVAMSTVFLVRLPEIGQSKAGWYKGTLTLGMQFAGPLTGNYAIANMGLKAGFLVSAAMFALLAILGWHVLPETSGRREGGASRNVGADGGQASSWRALWRLPAVRTTYLFEILASFTASSVGVFSLLLAMRVLQWPHQHAVWLMAVQGLSFVVVLLLLGKPVLGSPQRDRIYGGAHLAIMLALLILGTLPNTVAYLSASVLLGLGLGVNALVNTDRIAHAPVDKARVSSHLTLFGMVGGTTGALAAGKLADSIGLQHVFLAWLLPWLAAWIFYHLRRVKHKGETSA